MPPSADPIGLVEAAYAFEEPHPHWLARLAEKASDFSVGGGVVAYSVDPSRVSCIDGVALHGRATEQTAHAITTVSASFPAALVPRIFSPTEFVGNCGWRLRRLAAETGLHPEALNRRGTLTLPSMWALISGDPRRRTVVLAFPSPRGRELPFDEAFPRAASKTLGRVGAHLGAALRLRQLAGLTDAVLSPSGKVLHAEADAKSATARRALVDAVIASERARGRLRRKDPDEAVKAWQALVSGQWTIIDSVERDGKRMLLARKNPFAQTDLLQLTPAESEVAWLVSLGHSNKYVAYELGLPLSTIISRLRGAFRKLRVTNRAELTRKLGHRHPAAAPPA